MNSSPPAQIISSQKKQAHEALEEIKNKIELEAVAGVIFFCSSLYDLSQLQLSIESSFDFPVIGCTTAGEISDCYQTHSLVCLLLNAEVFNVNSALIQEVQNFNLSKAMKLANTLESNLKFNRQFDANHMFGFLLTDGLSLLEERITSLLYQVMGNINIIGGSAADDFNLDKTFVFHNNQFHEHASVILIIEVLVDFEVFRLQHFEPTEKELITTEVDFEKRIVKEINGEPAAIAYASINGLDYRQLDNVDFAMYPLMLQIADKWYIRSISMVNPDLSLQFHCAIDYGLPLRIATGKDLVQRLQQEVSKQQDLFSEIYFTMGCDCILRRLEIFEKGYSKPIEKLLNQIKFIGFSSYGEQFNGIHFNQTLVGVVVGKKRHE